MFSDEIAAGELDGHPAVSAWLQLQVGHVPSAVERMNVNVRKASLWPKSSFCLLVASAPDGNSVVAKRSRSSSILAEARIYLEVVGPLGLDLPHCYGCLEDADGVSAWLFLEEVWGVNYSEERASHRLRASSWLGKMHEATHGLGSIHGLPPLHLERYWDFAQFAKSRFSRAGMPSGLSDTERAVLGDALKVLERMEEMWPSIAQLWDAAPHCVVHGDFIDKNVLIDESGDSPRIRVIDWEAVGWGVPAEDLAGLDISTYFAHAPSLWDSFGEARLARLAVLGSMFRALAFLQSYSLGLDFGWCDGDAIARYAQQLAHLLDQFRFARGPINR